jgi:tRNA threonylcarbamoyl adenosine modification protein (Sua5/YciO/YrdC/YwlC family)
MKTEYLLLDGTSGDAAKINHAAQLLRSGALVAFPTETVYGVGADARNPQAIAELSRVKERRDGKPYALLAPSLRYAEEAVGGFDRISGKLARIYWPGPLTLVIPTRDGTSLGLRLSEHPVPRSLLAQCGFALATPSANLSGTAEPITAKDVCESLNGKIALILDGGPAWKGRPSTVVKVSEESVQIQREGMIPAAEIMEEARPTVLLVCTGNTCRSPMAAACLRAAAVEWMPEGRLGLRIHSAGTNALEGEGAHPLAAEVMRELNLDLGSHRARNLTFAMLDGADWIFAMTRTQCDSILALMPSCADRLRLLSKNNEDIIDPAASSLELYRRTRDKIAACLRDVLRLILESE